MKNKSRKLGNAYHTHVIAWEWHIREWKYAIGHIEEWYNRVDEHGYLVEDCIDCY